MEDVTQTAQETLEILNRDGWCKGAFTFWFNPVNSYPHGSHCLGGAWTLARNSSLWLEDEEYVPLWELITSMYPDYACLHSDSHETVLSCITCWNDNTASEGDVRAVLEKLAAG